MITEEQQRQILLKAYVPEQIVGMMTILSGGEPYLLEDFLCFARDDWLMLIGYPLERQFRAETLERVLQEALRRFRPGRFWFIAPQVPNSFSPRCTDKESDFYYTLNLEGLYPKGALLRRVQKASRKLTVEKSKEISEDHEKLILEFLARETLTPRVRELFLGISRYVRLSPTCVVLSARDSNGRLTAMYVVELAAASFAAYLVGCHSKENYVPYASDLLFYEMISLSRQEGKGSVNLGLGVNEGIRRFKEKWGAVPWLRYEFCGCLTAVAGVLQFLRQFGTGR